MTSRPCGFRSNRGWTLFAAAIGLCLLTAPAVSARDYFVRPDGNDSNVGTSNSATSAWRTPNKCAGTLSAGDRCFIQPGVYQVTAQIDTARAGTKVDNVMSSCSCTKGSTSISCGSAVTGVSSGDFVQCDYGYGFFWTEVASVSGSTITLVEGYRGPSSSNNTLDRAAMIQYIGASGTTPTNRDTVVITDADPDPGLTWTLESGTTCVYSTSKADPRASGAWVDPGGIRENVPWTQWNTYYENKNGLDTYWRVSASACPCNRTTLKAALEDVPGSWNEDTAKVYVHTYGCANPAAIDMEAGTGISLVFLMDQPFTIARNLTVELVGADPVRSATGSSALMVTANNNVLVRNVRCHGRCGLDANNVTDVRFESVRSLNTFKVGRNCNTAGCNQNNSGLSFYDVEARGGGTNTISIDDFGGASAADPIVFDRFYVHRGFTMLSSPACNEYDNWDCSVSPGHYLPSRVTAAVHGLYASTTAQTAADVKNVLVQNCVVEVTGDGLGLFTRSDASNIKVRNCTFASGEIVAFGNGPAAAGGISLYNNAFHFTGPPVGNSRVRFYGGAYDSSLVSDYNAWLVDDNGTTNIPQSSSAYLSYNPTHIELTLDTVRASLGQEAHSVIVCASGCSSAQGLSVFNDGVNQSRFTDPSVADGDPTNWTPVSGSRVINAGLNAECPPTDFYGNPRSDGRCDIGAIEFQGGTADTTPPAPVTALVATGQDSAVALSWTQSSSGDASGAVIRVRTDRYPTSATDGTEACRADGNPATAANCRFAPASNGQQYFLAAFSYDRAGNHGTAVNAQAVPSAAAPPPPVTGVTRSDTMPPP
jgi:hypothetical protein